MKTSIAAACNFGFLDLHHHRAVSVHLNSRFMTTISMTPPPSPVVPTRMDTLQEDQPAPIENYVSLIMSPLMSC